MRGIIPADGTSSVGVYQDPSLLLLSGIGAALLLPVRGLRTVDTLEELGVIDVVDPVVMVDLLDNVESGWSILQIENALHVFLPAALQLFVYSVLACVVSFDFRGRQG